MTSRTVHRALISLALVPWVSAAPAVQPSDLPFIKSLFATCDFDLNQIRHDLCTPVHSILEIIDLDTVGIIDVGEHPVMQRTMGEWICRSDEDSPASAARLQTLSDTPITKRRPACDLNSLAGRSVKYKRLIAPSESNGDFQLLLPGNTKTRTDEAVDENIIAIESGVRDIDTKQKQKDRHRDKDAAGEGYDGGPNDEDPIDEENGQELIPQTDRNFWSLTAVLFVTSCLLIVAVRLFYVRLVRPYRKPLRFRIGEAALLRWASEDMIFDDEELDTMVNGSGSLTVSEEIPLNPSPTKSFSIQYGSAQ